MGVLLGFQGHGQEVFLASLRRARQRGAGGPGSAETTRPHVSPGPRVARSPGSCWDAASGSRTSRDGLGRGREHDRKRGSGVVRIAGDGGWRWGSWEGGEQGVSVEEEGGGGSDPPLQFEPHPQGPLVGANGVLAGAAWGMVRRDPPPSYEDHPPPPSYPGPPSPPPDPSPQLLDRPYVPADSATSDEHMGTAVLLCLGRRPGT